MPLYPRRPSLVLALLVVLAAVLVVLATLQYRWISTVSNVEEQRMRSAMDFAAHHFTDDFDRELGRTLSTFRMASAADAELHEQLLRRYDDWLAPARNPHFIGGIFVVDVARSTNDAPVSMRVQRLDLTQKTFADTQWPPLLGQGVRSALERVTAPGLTPEQARIYPLFAAESVIVVPLRPAGLDGDPPPRPREPGGERPPAWIPEDGDRGGRPPRGPADPPPPRREPPPPRGANLPPTPDGERVQFGGPNPFDGPPPGHPPRRDTTQHDAARSNPSRSRQFIILELDRREIAQQMLPDLTRRYFQPEGDDPFDVAVVASDRVLFQSDRAWPEDPHTVADVTLPIFTLLGVLPGVDARRGPPPDSAVPPHDSWRLLVRHHGSSLADTVGRTRRGNLAVSVGVLFVLIAAVLALVMLLQRAERLRLQQLEFVAGITHDLNTPLTALTSAGANLADGIVSGEQIARYGTMIQRESRRLSQTVAQVLDYAGLQASRTKPQFTGVDLAKCVDDAVASCRWLADERAAAITVHVAPALPSVRGDSRALTNAISNLVANAIKYGGDHPRIEVQVTREKFGVAILVADHGPGVDPRDAGSLFQPFFRGRSATPIAGTGLGLTIVKEVAEAHGGSVELVRPRDAEGATFIIHLPLAKDEGA